MKADTEYWDKTAQDWQAGTAGAEYRLWRRHSDAVNRRLLSQWMPSGKSVLKTDLFDEAMCDGLLDLLKDRSSLVVGMDVSETVLVSARKGDQIGSYIAGDVRRLPFANASFDCIISLSTLDHFNTVDEIESSIRELARTLRPGGTLVLTLDNMLNPLIWLRNGAMFPLLHRMGIVPYFVGKSCGPRTLRRLVGKAGLDVCEVGAVLHCPRVLAVACARRLLQAQESTKARFLRTLMSFEWLSRLPTRFFSGYFVAVRAVKR